MLISASRKQVESGTRKNLSTFAWTTSSGILRRHLYENHIALWVAGCDDLKISITAKSALQPVADYRERQGFIGTTIPEADTRQPFSHEAFIDAIVRFIVADDQVFKEHVSHLIYIPNFLPSSPLTLSKIPS